MARTNDLTVFLNDVSSAIKEKTGDNTPIPAIIIVVNIVIIGKIAEIETKGDYQQKSITITTNGTRTVLPDVEYDAIDEIEITTNVSTSQLQTKTVEITSNGTISILPDNNYDGMTRIDLVVNVQDTNNE